jgi:hypothetical protein
MRAATIALSLLLLSACARSGEETPMPEPVQTESAAAAPALAPVRDIRTATFALG